MLVDLHMHTHVSPCGGQSPEEIFKEARKKGLELICLTDHFTTAVRAEIQEGLQENGLLVFVGLEYTTSVGDFVLLAPGLTDLPQGLSPREVLQEVHRRGGVAIWAHPFRWGREPDETLLAEGLVDAIEVLNGRTSPRENAAAWALAQAFGLPGVAGSDAHLPDEIGTVANESEEHLETLEGLLESLRAGRLKPRVLRQELCRLYQHLGAIY